MDAVITLALFNSVDVFNRTALLLRASNKTEVEVSGESNED